MCMHFMPFVCLTNASKLILPCIISQSHSALADAIFGCCLSIKDYRGHAQGVTSRDYLIFLGYLPWIIISRVAKSWNVV